jgi:hypothetical protein
MTSHAGNLSPPVTRGILFGSTCTPVVAALRVAAVNRVQRSLYGAENLIAETDGDLLDFQTPAQAFTPIELGYSSDTRYVDKVIEKK